VLSWQTGEQLRIIPSVDATVLSPKDALEFIATGHIGIVTYDPRRIYFHYYYNNAKVAVDINRQVALQVSSNFLDLGGYKGDGVRPIIWANLIVPDR
tara:strand:- start:7222 stop:7512 length:291 start_codon:yes stop_codon:yes gene_type:complete